MQRLAKIRLPHGKISVWLYSKDGRHATQISTPDTPLDLSRVPMDALEDARVLREVKALAAALDTSPRVKRVQRSLTARHPKRAT